MRIDTKIQINRPVPEVFAYVTDVRKAVNWAGMLEEVIVFSKGPVRVGTKGVNRMRLLWKRAEVGWIITVLEPDRTFTVKSTGGPIDGIYYYRFKPDDNGTILKLTVEVAPRGALKVVTPVFGPALLPQISKDLQTLKAICEAI